MKCCSKYIDTLLIVTCKFSEYCSRQWDYHLFYTAIREILPV